MRLTPLVLFVLLNACSSYSADRSKTVTEASGGDVSAPSAPSPESPSPVMGEDPAGLPLPPSENSPGSPQSGLLTAGTWDDNLNFTFFRDYLKLRQGVIAPIEINRDDALTVEVKDATGKPLPGATVKLIAAAQPVFETMTRGEGRTLFFPSWDGAPAGAALSVEASFAGKTASQAVTAIDYMKADKKITLTLADTTAVAPASLDLAFLIDTTGSMGDELSYLKTEVNGSFPAVRPTSR